MPAMHLKMILIASLLIPAAATATPSGNEQTCVLKVADTLPKIAGMKIGKSRTSPAVAPAPPGWLLVDINWEAAGQKASWTYLCAVSPAGVVVQRVKR